MAKEKQIKQEYINIAYQILAEEGYEAVTVRRLAKETGRNTASLYYYFDSLSYLISIASVRYLMQYYDTLSNVIDQHYKALEVDLQSWVCLAWYAFHNVPIYENFFLYDIELSEKALYEYLELFPEERSLIDNYFMNNILLSLDIKAREKETLLLAVKEGTIALNDVDFLVNTDYYIFCGMMNELRFTYKDEKVVHAVMEKYASIMTDLFQRIMLPGNSILGCHLETISK